MVNSFLKVLEDDGADDYQRRAIDYKFKITEIKIQHDIFPISKREELKEYKI
jgi:hypothetical protein